MNCNDEIEILFKDRDDSYVVAQALSDAGWKNCGSDIGTEGRTIYFKPPKDVNPEDHVPEPIPVNLPSPLRRD